MDPGQTDSTGSGGRSKRILPEHLMMRWGSAENRDGPIFLQLAWFLTNLIIEGELDEGDLLPSETTLAEQFGMSRMTARRGIETLRDIGVVSRNRRGTRIEMSADEAASLSADFWLFLQADQNVTSLSAPLAINRRLDGLGPDSNSHLDVRQRIDEDLLSRSRRLSRSTSDQNDHRARYVQSQDALMMDSSSSLDYESGTAHQGRANTDYEQDSYQQRELGVPPSPEIIVPRTVAAVGVGRFGHEVVTHMVANLVEEDRSSFGGRPSQGLRVIAIDEGNNTFTQVRSPIKRALRSLRELANNMPFGPQVDLLALGLDSLDLEKQFSGLELCFLVSSLGELQHAEDLPRLIQALENQGTKTIALVSLPEEWESTNTISKSKACLKQILATKASVIGVPIDEIATPGEDLPWEDHLKEVVNYFSTAFEAMLRASSWIEGASTISETDIYSVLRPGRQGSLSVSQRFDTEQGDRIRNLVHESCDRLIRHRADISAANQILAILSGYRSFTRSEVRTLISELKSVCGEETEILFGTSHLAIGPRGLCLTLIV